MVHAIPVTVPPSAWQTTLVRRGDGETVEQTHAVWRLEAEGPGGWRVVNAGGITRGGVEIVRGRFHADETAYRVLWVPEGGGGFLPGQTGPLDGRNGRRRLGGPR